MLMIEYKDIAWWYWLITVTLLTVGMFTDTTGFYLAIGLTVVHTIHYFFRERSVSAFPVQVRIAYLFLLLISLPEHLQFVFWIPLVGTWAQVIFGYCAMARFLSLFSWNRREPFTIHFLMKTIFARPVRGSVLQGFADTR